MKTRAEILQLGIRPCCRDLPLSSLVLFVLNVTHGVFAQGQSYLPVGSGPSVPAPSTRDGPTNTGSATPTFSCDLSR